MFDQGILGKYLSTRLHSDIKLHSWILARLIWNYCENPLNLTGAEIGVLKGENVGRLIQLFPNIFIHCVDMWEDQNIYNEWLKFKYHIFEVLDKARHPITDLQPQYGLREHRCKSTEAPVDEPLDFVWIDADHSYEGCLADLEYWVPKVKKGGVIAGHNINDRVQGEGEVFFGYHDVRNAVEKYFGKNNFNLAPDFTWWTIK